VFFFHSFQHSQRWKWVVGYVLSSPSSIIVLQIKNSSVDRIVGVWIEFAEANLKN
jgi:hypothetical protein